MVGQDSRLHAYKTKGGEPLTMGMKIYYKGDILFILGMIRSKGLWYVKASSIPDSRYGRHLDRWHIANSIVLNEHNEWLYNQ